MKASEKFLSLMFVLFSTVILNVSAQTYSWVTIQTPKGTELPDGILSSPDMDNYEKNYWKDYYLWYYDNRIVFEESATHSFNCHGYAWWVTEGGSNVWIGRPYHPEDEDVFWDDGSYIEVPYQSWATKVSYGSVEHSAITTGTNDWFKSKWGSLPVFSHNRADCPYDDGDLHYYARNNAYISGPYEVCPSGTEFMVKNLLPGATVSWSTSPNITRISSQGSNPCQFQANENGQYGWIDATFTFNGIQYDIEQKAVWVGSDLSVPLTISITGEHYEWVEHMMDMWELCPNTIYRLVTMGGSPISQWDWTIPESWELLSDENRPEILIRTGDELLWEEETHVDVYNNKCDTWIYFADWLTTMESPNGCGELLQINLYPNPASNSVEVELNSAKSQTQSSEYSVSIVDNTGTVYYSSKETSKKFTIPVSNLKNGKYFVTVFDGKARHTKTLLIKH